MLKKIFNGSKKIYKKLTLPEKEYRTWIAHQKGEAFESYVLNQLFPEEYFEILDMTHNFETNSKRYVKKSLKPDFLLKDKKTGKIFYVECKYRSKLYQDKFHWAKSNEQSNRYRTIEKEENIQTYIAMGLGGTPENPDNIYLMPLKEIKYNALFPSILKNWEITNKYDVFKIVNL
ncbi:hypothetical protein [Methanothermococcus okinawensis]|uniref:Uncharacterized protein n=1 Tax=Methanothermococcus okinawensis (strain DSM 14208 / JCM 11175 / IH1) TaxID=647113 RepID=F8AKL8_METOI|nr:hypothetical protein [Methanothermococcus okinawensis]AEH06351.1 hypothetical protein Metok_0362 [Methanothermococcus okinawensis IH1]